jgi:Spy/CpxP family protein refolding chaperone
MKKLVLTALTTGICSLSIAAALVAPSIAQPATPATPTAAPAAGANPQAQLIEQLKITKEQQIKLAKLEQSVRQKNIAVLTPSQQEQLIAANKQGKAPNITLTTEQQTKLKAIYVAAIAKQDEILTPAQKRKLQEIQKQYQYAPKPQN